MKRTAAFITALTMAFSVCAISASAINGDVNGDGKVNVTDISIIAAHVKGKKLLNDERKARADVNGDGKINISDITFVAAHVKGKRLLKEEPALNKRALVEYDFGMFKEAVGGEYELTTINEGQPDMDVLAVYNFDVFPNTYFIFGNRGRDCIKMTESGVLTFDKDVFEKGMNDTVPAQVIQVVNGGKIGDTGCVVGMKYSELKEKLGLGKAVVENSSLSPNIRTIINGVNWNLVFNDEATRKSVKNKHINPDTLRSDEFTFEELGIDPVCTYAISNSNMVFPTYSFERLKDDMNGEYDVEVVSIGQAAGAAMYNDEVFPNIRFVFRPNNMNLFKETADGYEVDRKKFEKIPGETFVYAVEYLPGAEIPGRGGAKVGMKYSELKDHISLGKAYKTPSEFSPVIDISMPGEDWMLVFDDPSIQNAIKDISIFGDEKFSFEDYNIDPKSTRMVWFNENL